MNINEAIRIFANFLNDSFTVVKPLLTDREYTNNESSVDDWLQANWELLVERKVLRINEYLDVYGAGADFYGGSSRITDHNALPTYTILVSKISQRSIDVLNNTQIEIDEFIFERIVGFKEGFYSDTPPFDYVLVNDVKNNVERVFLLDNTKFELKKIKVNEV
jgi:hypothetical protein